MEAPEQPVRNLTAKQVGERLGRDARAVLYWAKEGCPSTIVKGRGGESPRFNLAEVEKWLASKGRTVIKARSAATPSTPEVAPAGAGVNSAQAPTGSDGGNVVVKDERRELPLLKALYEELSGDVDYDLVITDARATIRELRRKAENVGFFTAEIQQLAGSFKSMAGELRMLEEARFKKQQREGDWMRRDVAQSILVAEAGLFTADLQSLSVDLPRAVMDAIGTMLPPEQLEAAMRLAAVAARAAIDRVRLRRADSIDRATRTLTTSGSVAGAEAAA